MMNNAEDLDEDEREGIRTASVVLGTHGAVSMALGLTALGTAGLVALLAWQHAPTAWIPLLSGGWALYRLAAVSRALRGLDEGAARARIRAEGKHVPGLVERNAWAVLIAVVGARIF